MRYFLILAALYSNICLGGLLLEPYAGWDYSLGGTKETTPETNVSYNNWDVGFRLGWVWKTFMFGADADYKRMKAKFEQSGVTTEPKFDVGNVGLFMGVWLPLKLNFRIGYNIFSEWREVDGDGKYKGNGFNLGIGFRFWYMALNLDLKTNRYYKFENIVDENTLKTYDIGGYQ
jgi:hypothetical protein